MFHRLFIFCSIVIPCFCQAEIKVLAFAGSTRTDSMNKMLIKDAAEIAGREGAKVTIIDLKDYPLPLYDGDLETRQGLPANAKKIQKLMLESQIIMIATPEYNGGVPAVLKNTIDWTTRNEKGGGTRDAFKGKYFVIMSTSPSNAGGSKGLDNLQTIIQHIGGTVIEKKLSIANGSDAFDASGRLKNQEDRKALEQQIKQAIQTVKSH